MESNLDYHETQYLGYNRFGIIRRTVIVLFCLGFYYASGVDDQTRTAFFFLAIVVLVLSAISLIIKHLETRIEGTTLRLFGPMTHKKVEMDLRDIRDVEIKPYSKFLLNRPMFNLHKKNSIRFYTHGNSSVVFTNSADEVITLGTQRPLQLKAALDKFVQ